MRRVVALLLVVVALAAGAPVASATSSATTQIITDAADGTINGHYTAAQVRAALVVVEHNPVYSQYSDMAGVLRAYLASLLGSTNAGQPLSEAAAPAPQKSGRLDYTGGRPLLVFAVGGALIAAGAALRRRHAPPDC
jgi:hypothetical protein